MFTYWYNLVCLCVCVCVHVCACMCVLCDLTVFSKFMSKDVGGFSSFPPTQTHPVASDHPVGRICHISSGELPGLCKLCRIYLTISSLSSTETGVLKHSVSNRTNFD